jgi:putative phosphoribosyl transferase
VPVAPPDAIGELKKDADEVVCLEQPAGFGAISLYYADFEQVSDEEVMAILARFPVAPPPVSMASAANGPAAARF